MIVEQLFYLSLSCFVCLFFCFSGNKLQAAEQETEGRIKNSNIYLRQSPGQRRHRKLGKGEREKKNQRQNQTIEKNKEPKELQEEEEYQSGKWSNSHRCCAGKRFTSSWSSWLLYLIVSLTHSSYWFLISFPLLFLSHISLLCNTVYVSSYQTTSVWLRLILTKGNSTTFRFFRRFFVQLVSRNNL